MKKFNFISTGNKILSIFWLVAILFSIIGIAFAVTPNPGHDFTAVSGGAVQGDLFYGSAADTLSALGKNTSATRYLSNTGASNNPAWAQIDLTNGVTGTIGTANLGSGTANSTTFLRGDSTWTTPSASVAWGGITGTLSNQTDLNTALAGKEATANKDATGGYAGLTLFKINFKNAANTITSFFTNTNTIARTYTAVDRNATIGNDLNNFSTADQTVAAATSALLTGSLINVPAGKLQIGTVFKWRLSLSKTAAGTAANTFFVRVGTNCTVADTARLTFAMPVGTAAADVGQIDITATVRGPLSSSGVMQGHFSLNHNLAATGLSTIGVNVNSTSAGFDVTTANLCVSLSVTTAASTVLTFQQVITEVINL